MAEQVLCFFHKLLPVRFFFFIVLFSIIHDQVLNQRTILHPSLLQLVPLWIATPKLINSSMLSSADPVLSKCLINKFFIFFLCFFILSTKKSFKGNTLLIKNKNTWVTETLANKTKHFFIKGNISVEAPNCQDSKVCNFANVCVHATGFHSTYFFDRVRKFKHYYFIGNKKINFF